MSEEFRCDVASHKVSGSVPCALYREAKDSVKTVSAHDG